MRNGKKSAIPWKATTVSVLQSKTLVKVGQTQGNGISEFLMNTGEGIAFGPRLIWDKTDSDQILAAESILRI